MYTYINIYLITRINLPTSIQLLMTYIMLRSGSDLCSYQVVSLNVLKYRKEIQLIIISSAIHTVT